MSQYIDTLAQHPFFADFERSALEDLVDKCEPHTLMIGQALWSQGEEGTSAYILVSGRVEQSYRVQPDGQRNEQFSEPGSLMSLSALVQSWEYRGSATPLERSEVLELSRETFAEMFEAAHPAAYRLVDAIAEELVEEMRDANRRLHEVFGHPAETLRMLRRRIRERQ